MDTGRKSLYSELEGRIGHTFLELTHEDERGNILFTKKECDNPFGSHYDRVYIALFKDFEERGEISPGSKVLETSSGTAALSYVKIGNLLGFECHVVIPEGIDQVVIDEVEMEAAKVYFTPEADYIVGFPQFLREFLPSHKDFSFLNHSQDRKKGGPAYTCNEVTLRAMGDIIEEISESIDVFIPAVGNGSSILGPARFLQRQGRIKSEVKIVPFESAQAAVLFDKIDPGDYKRKFGIEPGSLPRHRLRGTSYQGVDFPHIDTLVAEKLVERPILVSDAQVNENYFRLTGNRHMDNLPRWDTIPIEGRGRSTRAGVAVALELMKLSEGKRYLIIGYDKAGRYDS